jgi:hypothetical protein
MYNIIVQPEHQSCGGVVEHTTKAQWTRITELGYVHSVKSYGKSRQIATTRTIPTAVNVRQAGDCQATSARPV